MVFNGTTNKTNTGVQFNTTVNLENGGVGQAKLDRSREHEHTRGYGHHVHRTRRHLWGPYFQRALTGRGVVPGGATVSAVDNLGNPFSLHTNLAMRQ